MADLNSVIDIVVRAHDKASAEIKKAMSEVTDSLAKAKKQSEEAKKAMTFDDVVPSIKKVGDALGKLGTVGAGVVATVSYIGLELNKYIAMTGSVAGATADEMKKLEEVARQMARTQVTSAEDIARAQYYIASAGFKAADMFDMLGAVTSLAGATFSDMALASQIVVNSLSQFGFSAEQATRVADVLTTAITNSQATLGKLADTLKYVGPVAASLGVSLESVVAAAMLLYNAGLAGEQAGTGLRNVLDSLVNPSENAIKAFGAMGLSVEELNVRTNGLIGTLERLSQAGASTEALFEIFGREGGVAAIALVEGTEKLREFEALLRNSAGAAANVAEQMKNTPYGQYRLAVNQLKELAYEAFPAVFSAVKALAEPLLAIARGFSQLSDGAQQAIAQTLVYGSATLLAVGGVTKLISTIAELTKAMKTIMALDWAATMKNWVGAFQAFATSATGQIAAVTSAVGLLVYNIYQASQLIMLLAERQRLLKEAEQIKKAADVGELSVELSVGVRAVDTRAFEELTRKAKELQKAGLTSTVQEAIIVTLAVDESGAVADVANKVPTIREQAQRALKELKLNVDVSEVRERLRSIKPEPVRIPTTLDDQAELRSLKAEPIRVLMSLDTQSAESKLKQLTQTDYKVKVTGVDEVSNTIKALTTDRSITIRSNLDFREANNQLNRLTQSEATVLKFRPDDTAVSALLQKGRELAVKVYLDQADVAMDLARYKRALMELTDIKDETVAELVTLAYFDWNALGKYLQQNKDIRLKAKAILEELNIRIDERSLRYAFHKADSWIRQEYSKPVRVEKEVIVEPRVKDILRARYEALVDRPLPEKYREDVEKALEAVQKASFSAFSYAEDIADKLRAHGLVPEREFGVLLALQYGDSEILSKLYGRAPDLRSKIESLVQKLVSELGVDVSKIRKAIAGAHTELIRDLASKGSAEDEAKAMEVSETVKRQFRERYNRLQKATGAQALNELKVLIREFSPSAMDDLTRSARALQEAGIAKTREHAELLAMVADKTGAYGALAETFPEIRQEASRLAGEYRVKVTLDPTNFEVEWHRLGQQILEQVTRFLTRYPL